MITVTVEVPGRPWTTNAALKWHWAKRNTAVGDVRWAVAIAARAAGAKPMTGCTLTIQAFTAGRLADPDAYSLYSKALVDGLTGVVWEDDKPPHLIAAPTHLPHAVCPTAEQRVVLTITGTPVRR